MTYLRENVKQFYYEVISSMTQIMHNELIFMLSVKVNSNHIVTDFLEEHCAEILLAILTDLQEGS